MQFDFFITGIIRFIIKKDNFHQQKTSQLLFLFFDYPGAGYFSFIKPCKSKFYILFHH